MRRLLAVLLAISAAQVAAQTQPVATPAAQPVKQWPNVQGSYTIKNFKFRSGETLPELKLGYTTLGTPIRDRTGRITNAVMGLHGTGGSGRSLLNPAFSDELFGPDAPFDLATTYVILPDNIGHGNLSKPSDGLRMQFPHYDYDDMVEAQRRLLVEHLGVSHLKLIIGTSMGCMQAFVWGTTHPGFAERLAPFACNTREIAGRNRMWRKMVVDAIKADPLWEGGNYKTQPVQGLRTANYLSILAGGNPVALQARYPTRELAEKALADGIAQRGSEQDANDIIYQYESSRSYNPYPSLGRVTVPVLWINSADDFINPPELGLAQEDVKRMPRARFLLIPASADTKGHGTHTWAKFWKADIVKLLGEAASYPRRQIQ